MVVVGVRGLPVAEEIGRGVMAVGAALRMKGPLDVAHGGAEAHHHIGNDVVIADIEGAITDFAGQMPVAEMPGDARQRPPIRAGDFQETLGGGFDGNDTAVLQADAVATGEHRCLS